MVKIDWAKAMGHYVYFGWYYSPFYPGWFRLTDCNKWIPIIPAWIVWKKINERFEYDR